MNSPTPSRRSSLRTRLTLLYTGLFLVAGVLLLGTTYLLFTQQLKSNGGQAVSFTNSDESGTVPSTNIGRTSDGHLFTGKDAELWAQREQRRLHSAATTSLITQGAIALAAVAAAATGLGYLAAGRFLRPLQRVTETARRISDAPADRGLHERIKLARGRDDEVKVLADTFDTMVERLDRAFDSQRHFIANASHELRTPLTLNRALVEMAMHRKAASPDVLRLGEDLLTVNSRHERLINGLLILADAENHAPERVAVDLADIIDQVIVDSGPELQEAGVTLRDESGPTPTRGDALLLERLVRNLVENAVRHNTGPGGQVTVRTRTRPEEGAAELEISNTGPAVPAYEIPALFQPFRRLARDRAAPGAGTGLGLSIVAAIAGAHDGRIAAVPNPGGGLTVTATLPLDTQTQPDDVQPRLPSRTAR